MGRAHVLKARYDALEGSAAIRQSLAAEGYEIMSITDPPGTTYGRHSHLHDEYIVVKSGRMAFAIDGQHLLVESGDALVLPAGTVHAGVNRDSQPVEYFICTRLL